MRQLSFREIRCARRPGTDDTTPRAAVTSVGAHRSPRDGDPLGGRGLCRGRVRNQRGKARRRSRSVRPVRGYERRGDLRSASAHLSRLVVRGRASLGGRSPLDAGRRDLSGRRWPRVRREGSTDFTRHMLLWFLLPRRPTESESAKWVFCYGCDDTMLGERFRILSLLGRARVRTHRAMTLARLSASSVQLCTPRSRRGGPVGARCSAVVDVASVLPASPICSGSQP